MTFYSLRKTGFLPGLASFGFFVLALPVIGIIGTAIWITTAAAYENVKFVHCTEQILTIVSQAQDDASRDATFGQTEGEDIIETIVRRGQMTERPAGNGWGGSIRGTAQPSPFLRIETDLPARACRRLALFFGKNADDLKLQKMEARDSASGPWSPFFDVANNAQLYGHAAINKACGQSDHATIALTFRLH